MKLILTVLGGFIAVIGAVWFLQGLSLLPGTFMVGDRHWTINGAIAVVIGLGMVVFAQRKVK